MSDTQHGMKSSDSFLASIESSGGSMEDSSSSVTGTQEVSTLSASEIRSLFSFNFYSLVDYQEACTVLEQWMEERGQMHSWKLMAAIDQFSTLKSSKNRFTKAMVIAQTFLLDKTQVEIAPSVRNKVLRRLQLIPARKHDEVEEGDADEDVKDLFGEKDMQMEKDKELDELDNKVAAVAIDQDAGDVVYDEEDIPKDTFEELYEYLFRRLEMKEFPKFIASEHFRFFLDSYAGTDRVGRMLRMLGATEKRLIETSSRNESFLFDFVDMNSDTVHDQDFQRIDALDSAEHGKKWKLCTYHKEYSGYVSREGYRIKARDGGTLATKSKIFKTIFVVPYKLERVMQLWLKEGNIAQLLDGFKVLNSVERQDGFSYSVVHFKHKMIWPLQQRDFVCVWSTRKDKKRDRYLICCRSCEYGDNVKTKSCVRGYLVGGYILDRTTTGHTRICEIMLQDFKSVLNSSVWNKLSSNRAASMHNSFVSFLKRNRLPTGQLREVSTENERLLRAIDLNTDFLQRRKKQRREAGEDDSSATDESTF